MTTKPSTTTQETPDEGVIIIHETCDCGRYLTIVLPPNAPVDREEEINGY